MQALIHIQNADIGYTKADGTHTVLRQLNAELYASELIGVVGVNGSGKSSLLKTMAGLMPVLSGNIVMDGQALNGMNEERLAKKLSLVLTEKFGGFNLRVKDVVESGLMPHTNAFHRLYEKEHAVVDAAITQCGLDAYKHTPVEELSDGYFQRMVIAKALAQQTPVMLLDEPAAFLDYAGKHELMRMLKHLCDTQQKCVLITSHDLDILLKYCHRILILHAQEASLVPCAEARTHPAFLQMTGGYL